MLREKEIEVIFIDISDNENIDEVIRRFTGHVLDTTSDDEEGEIVFSTEIFLEFPHSIKAFSKDHLEVGKDSAGEVE